MEGIEKIIIKFVGKKYVVFNVSEISVSRECDKFNAHVPTEKWFHLNS